jgi:hypothetical protein
MSIVQSGLILNLDAGNTYSYPRTGIIWTDLSGNNNNGTLVNGPIFNSTNGGSIVFDGNDDFVNCGNVSNLQITTGTISAWVKTTTPGSGFRGIITKQGNWGLFVKDNILTTYDWSLPSNTGTRTTNINIADGTWKNVVMTFTENTGTPSNNAIIYLNGNPVLTTTIKYSFNSVNVELGRGGSTPGGTIQLLNGNIAQSLVYNRVLTPTEVLQNYNSTKAKFETTVQSGLVLNLDAGNTNSYPGTGLIWTDLTGNNNNGTLTGGPIFNSTNGRGFLFDGVNDYISTNYDLSWNNTNSISIYITLSPSSITQNRGFIGKNNNWEWQLNQRGSGLELVYWNTSGGHTNGPITTIPNIFDLNTPVNICLVWNHIENKHYFYKNGVYVGENTWINASINQNRTNGVNIGGSIYGWGLGGENWSGTIYNVGVYNRVLTPTEILQNYNATKVKFETTVQSGLVLNLDAGNTNSYPGAGTTWTDLTGNNNNGTLVNTPTFDSVNGGSIVFDGVNEFADLGNILNYTSENFTFSYWVNFIKLTTNQVNQGPIIIYKGSFNVNGYYDQINADGRVTFVTNSPSNIGSQTSSGEIITGNTYNICYTRNGTSIRIYINGVDKTMIGGVHQNPITSNNNFRLCNYQNNYILSNVRLFNFINYNRALSPQEVLQNYDATKGRYETIDQSGPILHLDAGNINSYPKTGIIWTDLSGNGNIGTLINAPTFNSANLGSIVFDGIDDYAPISGPNFFTIPNPNLSQGNKPPTFNVAPWYPVYDNFTYEFVCKPTSGATIVTQSTTGILGTSGQRYITNANKSTDGQNNGNFVISVGTNVIQVFDHGDGYMPCLLSYTVNISSTAHIVITVVNKQPSLYINGVFIKTGLTSTKTKVELSAAGATVNTSVYGKFSGNINIFKYYKRTLSSQEIFQNYNSVKGRFETIVQNGPILDLDAGNTNSYPGTGTIWKDLSGNNNNGTLVNGPTFDSGNGGNITFNNTSTQSVSGNIILSPSFTVEVIFMPITMGNYSPVFTVGLNNGSGSWGDFVLHTTSTGAIYCGTDILTRLTPSDTGCGPGAFLVNNIYHMTFTFSDGIGSLYKDGVLLKSKTMTKPLNISTPVPYRIQNNSGFASSMRVYNFRIHNKALTSQEVLQKYNETKPDCNITANGVEVFPNSATTIFRVLSISTCAKGELADGPTRAMTITKVGKDGVDKYVITAIPSNGSIFKGWNKNLDRNIFGKYKISETQPSFPFTISDGTIWYAIFDKDCSYIGVPFCFSTDKNKLCFSCETKTTVYFDNRNNLYVNNGITNNTFWYGSTTLETLITFEDWGGIRVGWSFNFSSSELSGGGTFKEERADDYDPGCSRIVNRKKVILECRVGLGNITPYIVFLYKNNVKIGKFDRVGNSDIELFNQGGNSSDLSPIYKLKYVSYGSQNISFTISTETEYRITTGGLFCTGGYERYYSTFTTRATTPSLISPDGYYTQLTNGQYSDYNVIYRVYQGQIIQVLDCRSDILDCRG